MNIVLDIIISLLSFFVGYKICSHLKDEQKEKEFQAYLQSEQKTIESLVFEINKLKKQLKELK